MDVIGLLLSIGPVAAICLLVGLGLVIFEMFHPGISIPGIAGGILLLIGVILSARTPMDAIVLLLILFAILGIFLTVVLHSATRGHLSRVMVLSESLSKEPKAAAYDDMAYFMGKEGYTLTPLRPSGMADFEGVRLDVISEGEFIDKDVTIQIIRMDGRKIVVKEAVRK